MLRAQWLLLPIAVGVSLWGCGDSTDSTLPPLTPSVSAISPTSIVAGSSDLVLNVTGHYFVDDPQIGTKAIWRAGGQTSTLPTNVVNTTQLTALIPAALLSSAGSAQIWVQTGDLSSDPPPPQSNITAFTVTPAPPRGGDE
jgi:hypothetical protein